MTQTEAGLDAGLPQCLWALLSAKYTPAKGLRLSLPRVCRVLLPVVRCARVEEEEKPPCYAPPCVSQLTAGLTHRLW